MADQEEKEITESSTDTETKDEAHSSSESEPSAAPQKSTESDGEEQSDQAAQSEEGEVKDSEGTASAVAAPADIESENETSQAYSVAADHEAIQGLLGLSKPLSERGKFEQEKKSLGVRPFIVLFISAAVIAGSIAAWFGFQYALDKQEEARFIAKKELELAEEEARHNRIEYADIAFLDSFPPAVAIAMDGKLMYARSKDGSYTELRARESTWIQNLPIKEDTVLKFTFEAEGFRTLSRSVAYYDWFPSNKPGGNPLQKAFKKIVLEPDVSPLLPSCETQPRIMDSDPCEWSVFREIAFREKYAETVKPLVANETKQRESLKSLLTLHPLLAAAATGFDVSTLNTNKPIIAPELPDATKALLKTLTEQPYGLYGSITIETDSPDTKVFFMSEPLMVVKSSGSMSQVKIQPGEPYTFATYGQGKPIDIAQTLSLRLETNNAPAYIAEITPFQWHCAVPDAAVIPQLSAPEIPAEANSPDYRHYVCDYSIKISVKFKEILEIEAEAAKQREIQEAKEKAAKQAQQDQQNQEK
ncbi:MAG: hypothetical protein IJU23_08375 [Proteobacteria bacterium]|nr:hypothetical protein [Pseudomonadota bacterium]